MRKEIGVAARESGDNSVMVFVHPAGSADDIVGAFRRSDIPVAEISGGRGWASKRSDDPPRRATYSAVVILDSVEPLFTEHLSCSFRRRLRAREHDTCTAALTAVLEHGAQRLLLVCDARSLTVGQRGRALRWLRRAANRISYESAVNGAEGIVTYYAACNTDDDVHRLPGTVMEWHCGHEAIGPAACWPTEWGAAADARRGWSRAA